MGSKRYVLLSRKRQAPYHILRLTPNQYRYGRTLCELSVYPFEKPVDEDNLPEDFAVCKNCGRVVSAKIKRGEL